MNDLFINVEKCRVLRFKRLNYLFLYTSLCDFINTFVKLAKVTDIIHEAVWLQCNDPHILFEGSCIIQKKHNISPVPFLFAVAGTISPLIIGLKTSIKLNLIQCVHKTNSQFPLSYRDSFLWRCVLPQFSILMNLYLYTL